MHISSNDVTRTRQDFRDRVIEVIHRMKLTQKEIADACGVHQSTVHRWFSYGGDIDFPAALTRVLSEGPLKSLGLAILEFQAAGLGVEPRQIDAANRLDGSIIDDTLTITGHIGKLARLVGDGKLNHTEARKQLEAIRNTANVGLLELDRMEVREGRPRV